MNLTSLSPFALLFSIALPLCAQDEAAPKPKPASKPKAKAKVEVKSPEVKEAEALAAARAKSPYGEWTEADFPFFSSVLDARGLGEGWPKDNLTPRGLILNLGHDMW
ncbi:MAG: hypothetical protein RL693_1113, partial [Verrucomicrobiota bacterium]